MRLAFTAALAFAAFATAATAAPVSIAPVSAAPEFQEKIAEEFGERDAADLFEAVHDALSRELVQVGAAIEPDAPVKIEVVIEDAKPNRPTMKQLSDKPGLSYGLSFGVGGASLRARIVDDAGRELQTVSYAWYENDIRDAYVSSTWTDARRAIRRFAEEVAEAYAGRDGEDAPTPLG